MVTCVGNAKTNPILLPTTLIDLFLEDVISVHTVVCTSSQFLRSRSLRAMQCVFPLHSALPQVIRLPSLYTWKSSEHQTTTTYSKHRSQPHGHAHIITRDLLERESLVPTVSESQSLRYVVDCQTQILTLNSKFIC